MNLLKIFLLFSLCMMLLCKECNSQDDPKIFQKLKRNLFDESTGARCLDGTKYGVYSSLGQDEWGYKREEFLKNCLDRSNENLVLPTVGRRRNQKMASSIEKRVKNKICITGTYWTSPTVMDIS